VRDCKAVRRTRIDFEHGVLDDVGRRSGRGIDRDNLVIIAMYDQLATSNLLDRWADLIRRVNA
jgi:hypothetical protein